MTFYYTNKLDWSIIGSSDGSVGRNRSNSKSIHILQFFSTCKKSCLFFQHKSTCRFSTSDDSILITALCFLCAGCSVCSSLCVNLHASPEQTDNRLFFSLLTSRWLCGEFCHPPSLWLRLRPSSFSLSASLVAVICHSVWDRQPVVFVFDFPLSLLDADVGQPAASPFSCFCPHYM